MHNGRSNAEVPGKWISTENTGGEKLDLSWLDLMLIYIYLYNHMLKIYCAYHTHLEKKHIPKCRYCVYVYEIFAFAKYEVIHSLPHLQHDSSAVAPQSVSTSRAERRTFDPMVTEAALEKVGNAFFFFFPHLSGEGC